MTVYRKVRDLKPDDLVDLENDPYADPEGRHTEFAFEYLRVDTVELETPDCVAVWFDGFDCVGFPPNHLVAVMP